MFPSMSVSVAPSTLLQLMEHLRDSGGGTDPADAVDAAIRYWRAAKREEEPTAPRGYQWKSLFLPEGTWLRVAPQVPLPSRRRRLRLKTTFNASDYLALAPTSGSSI